MKLHDAVTLAYQKRWSMSNTFTIQINLPPALINLVGELGEEVNLNIVDIQTPDFTNASIEAFVANTWKIYNGRDELYRYTMTFRDADQLSLYDKFLKIYNYSRDQFFDDVCFEIIVYKDADWAGENQKKILTLGSSMVESVSNLHFNNTSDSMVSEFTVNFKSTRPQKH